MSLFELVKVCNESVAQSNNFTTADAQPATRNSRLLCENCGHVICVFSRITRYLKESQSI